MSSSNLDIDSDGYQEKGGITYAKSNKKSTSSTKNQNSLK
jgi:hypothetical protein